MSGSSKLSESTPLQAPAAAPANDYTSAPSAITFYTSAEYWKTTLSALFLTKLNILLLFIPATFITNAVMTEENYSPATIFILSLLALVPLAERLGFVTEQLALYTSQVIACLLNVSCGNVPELIVVIIALRGNELAIIQYSMIGGVLSNALLVGGLSFLFGGIFHKKQRFNSVIVRTSVLLLAMGGLSCVLVGAFESTDEPVLLANSTTPNGDAPAGYYTTSMLTSRLLCIALLLAYIAVCVYQMYTNRDEFEDEPKAELKAEGGGKAESGGEGEDDDDDDDDEEPILGLAGSIFWLVVLVVLITFMSDFLVGAIDGAAEDLGLSQIFLTAVVLPNVNNAPEHAVAIMFAIKNKMNGAVTIALGSAAQLLTFVLPLGVIGGWMVGVELTLELPYVLTYALVGSTLVVILATIHSESSWLTGVMLIIAYLVVAVVFFGTPDGELHEGLEPVGGVYDGVMRWANLTGWVRVPGPWGAGVPALSKVSYHLVANSQWLNPHDHGFNLDSIHWARLFGWSY